jgi:quinol monooxygenase YgiN
MAKIALTGRLICGTPENAALVERLLPEHSRLSRAEPGCLSVAVSRTEGPLIWQVAESFADRASFDAHQARTRASLWGRETAHIPRDDSLAETP